MTLMNNGRISRLDFRNSFSFNGQKKILKMTTDRICCLSLLKIQFNAFLLYPNASGMINFW